MNLFELSPDTRAIADRLAEVPHGGTITWAELSATIGRDIKTCTHVLYSAFNLVRKEHGAVFGSERKVGYTRATIEQAPAIGSAGRSHIRRTARRKVKDINAMMSKTNDVPNEVRLKVNAELSALGLIEHLARDKAMPPEKQESGPLPVAKAAKAFLAQIGATKD